MKTFKIKNYKGNIVESLKKFSDSHKGIKIVEAKEVDNELKIKVKESTQTFDDAIKNEILKVFENNVDLEKDYDTSFVVITKNLNPTKIGYIRDDLHKLLDKYPNLSWDEDDGDNGFYSRKYTFYFVDEEIKEASSPEDAAKDIAVEKGNKFFSMLAQALTMVFTEDVDSVEDFGTWKEFLKYIENSQLAITPSSDYNKKFEQAFKEFENAVNSL